MGGCFIFNCFSIHFSFSIHQLNSILQTFSHGTFLDKKTTSSHGGCNMRARYARGEKSNYLFSQVSNSFTRKTKASFDEVFFLKNGSQILQQDLFNNSTLIFLGGGCIETKKYFLSKYFLKYALKWFAIFLEKCLKSTQTHTYTETYTNRQQNGIIDNMKKMGWMENFKVFVVPNLSPSNIISYELDLHFLTISNFLRKCKLLP